MRPLHRAARVRFAVPAVVLAGLLGLSACGQANPAVVAYVDGTEITQQQLDDAVGGVKETLQEGQQVSPQAVVNVLVQGVIAERIAAQDGIAITDAQRDAVIKGSNLEPLLAVPAAKPVAYDAADQELVAQKLGSQGYLDRVAQQKVTLNPRYGVLDPQQKLIVSDQSGSLAKSASPTPEP